MCEGIRDVGRAVRVTESASPATVQAGPTVTVKPRVSSQDEFPLTDVDLKSLTHQTVEKAHVSEVFLGETLAPLRSTEATDGGPSDNACRRVFI